ncbi:hypothetical protein MMC25_007169 [Agyrium rufum]|nr:hypothetical protein [Agyrium rufum]
MVLEATMIVVDNSESSRNGDYIPSRWEAQTDAVHEIFRYKTNANPESSVGLMTMGGKGPEVLVTLTDKFGPLLEGIHRTKIRGQTHLATGIQVAGLALKHRSNKSQRQRIIVFTCSPIHDDQKTLSKLAKRMKKNNISIDFVAFGVDSADIDKLKDFNENVKGGDGSHLEIVPQGSMLLSEHLRRTPILRDESDANAGMDDAAGGEGDFGGASGGAGGSGGFEFGVDPSTDPELALALRMSMEEERARQERESRAGGGAEAQGQQSSLGAIPEESSETQPLLQESNQADGISSSTIADANVKEEKQEEDKKGEDDPDKMDTA